jgi:hypothetical protein
MAGIDDQIEAVKKQYPDESNATFDLILRVAGQLNIFAGVLNTIREQFSGRAAAEKVAALLNAFEQILRRLEHNQERLQEKLTSPEFVEALTVAVNETVRTSNRRKVENFAAILGYSAAEGEIRISFEDASAFIRDLAQLGDADVEALKILYVNQSPLFQRGTVPTDPNPYTEIIGEVHNAVDRAGISREEFYSRCSRLNGFGLAIEVMRNNGRMAPGDHCFRVTKRGAQLIEMLTGPVER